MKNIKTANLNIDPELCKRIDAARYRINNPVQQDIINRDTLYRAELLDLIETYNPEIAYIERTSGLYRLCCVVDAMESKKQQDAKEDIARGRANMQTAHNQLKNWR